MLQYGKFIQGWRLLGSRFPFIEQRRTDELRGNIDSDPISAKKKHKARSLTDADKIDLNGGKV
jgi:hypothetical protein